MKICIAPNHLLWNERMGGHAWVFLNWALGLRALGAEVVLLEKVPDQITTEEAARRLAAARARLLEVGLPAEFALLGRDAGDPVSGDPVPDAMVRAGEAIACERVLDESDLLLNFRYHLPADIVARFRRSALVDIDPGLLQHWMAAGQVRPAVHDLYFTIGETVGRADARFPDGGRDWIYTPPPVHLPAWPVTAAPATAPYTTVTNWWGEYEVVDKQWINNEKRTHFLACLDLPARTSARLELSIFHQPGHPSEMPMLEEHGWRTRPAYEVSATPREYRDYIRRSRGEFSCAKESCMLFQNAWISDRTICYLASGKPAVVQHTGPSRFLPDSEGLLRFRTPDEAVAQLARAEVDYAHHAACARALAEKHFDAARVLARLLDRALDGASAQRNTAGPQQGGADG